MNVSRCVDMSCWGGDIGTDTCDAEYDLPTLCDPSRRLNLNLSLLHLLFAVALGRPGRGLGLVTALGLEFVIAIAAGTSVLVLDYFVSCQIASKLAHAHSRSYDSRFLVLTRNYNLSLSSLLGRTTTLLWAALAIVLLLGDALARRLLGGLGLRCVLLVLGSIGVAILSSLDLILEFGWTRRSLLSRSGLGALWGRGSSTAVLALISLCQLLFDLGPGVGGRARVAHASQPGELLVVDLYMSELRVERKERQTSGGPDLRQRIANPRSSISRSVKMPLEALVSVFSDMLTVDEEEVKEDVCVESFLG
ncbi:hypothetical protein K491DRAFT_521503 [Lophiostoma macrostomum CBS 122681]|uniref:Uncharacterized protein n=1 Tax=Lophiostoma macrostomum CBS 122681 TaxID=1314788 RepID=A0A6A6T365_9PLEO|nr:hypothetical protein K491DRAFT_521503 [Lophiostoma macrostomum CBS 122681]